MPETESPEVATVAVAVEVEVEVEVEVLGTERTN
jgi:hypothetical protein